MRSGNLNDRVEWKFFITTMEKMSFCEKWVSRIFECISSVSYSILVNGEPKGDIKRRFRNNLFSLN